MESSALLILLFSPLVVGTALQTECVGSDRVYSGSSCYVLHKNASLYSKAKTACDDYLGYSGHLIFIRDNSSKAALHQLMSSNSVTTAYTGYEQTNTSGLRNASWAYASSDGTYTPASFIPWGRTSYFPFTEPSTNPANTRLAYVTNENGTKDYTGESNSFPFVCEYEESLMHTVTDLETSCAAINDKINLFANDHCYTISTSKMSYDSAKLSCNDIAGINGHLIHPRTVSQIEIFKNFVTAQGGTNSYGWTGIEQTNTSAVNSKTDGWYYTTPQGTDDMATFLPWYGTEPNGGTTINNVAYGLYYGGYTDELNTLTYFAICEYETTRAIAVDLNEKCTALNSTYIQAYTSDGNCYIMHTETKRFNNAQLSCRDFMGYYGHLVHLRNASQQVIINNIMNAAGVRKIWVGLEQVNLKEADSATNWFYVTPATNTEKATYLPWHSYGGGTTYNNAYYSRDYNDKLLTASNLDSNAFICQYEQSSQHPVTLTETFCTNNINKGWYFNGTCITAVDGASNGAQRDGCRPFAGLANHMVHLNTPAKWVMSRTLGRKACEDGGKQVIASPGCYSQYTGFEQLLACTGNACDEEPDKSWFWTTPEGYKWAADIYSTNVWDTGLGFPKDSSGTMNYAWFLDAGYQEDVGVKGRGAFCEYHEPYNFTPFQGACLKSSNPSTFINSTCYTLNRVSLVYAAAAKNCTEFVGGHLAFVSTSDIATKLCANLWANLGLPASRKLYTGMQQFPLSASDEPGKEWYYVDADGVKSPAVNPPWAVSEPNAAGNCTSFNQTGALTATSCTAAQWSICQYDDCIETSDWTEWSTCSQTCNKGVRNRQRIVYNMSSTCTVAGDPTTSFEYESCDSGTPCKASTTRVTAMQSDCASLSGYHYGYSTCYFVLNVSASQSAALAACQNQGGQLASLFGSDLVAQLGSVFLEQISTIQAWVGLQYIGGNLKWIVNNAQYTLFDNITTPPTGQSCFALISNKISIGDSSELPRLSAMDCSSILPQAICMKSAHIYSSYIANQGMKVTEIQSPELMSIEYDANDCGSRCSEIIGCLGFNYNPSDGSCIPTKVSLETATSVNGNQVWTNQTDAAWIHYERV
uniref:C-type lectin domain-containing protein n=1 Tax=Plectus sambesii TaxID=2011161 RepID=A0A914X4W9_9BILA